MFTFRPVITLDENDEDYIFVCNEWNKKSIFITRKSIHYSECAHFIRSVWKSGTDTPPPDKFIAEFAYIYIYVDIRLYNRRFSPVT